MFPISLIIMIVIRLLSGLINTLLNPILNLTLHPSGATTKLNRFGECTVFNLLVEPFIS